MISRLRGMFATLLLVSGLASVASADTIAFIGTGNVSRTLGIAFAGMGHDIIYGHREPDRDDNQALAMETGRGTRVVLPAEAVVDADIVVVAVPGSILTAVVAGLGDLSGKIIIDPTNPLMPDENGMATFMFPMSNAEMVQNMLPDAYVVKAFNTLGVEQMADPASAGGPITIPYAGNDDAAKAAVHQLIEGLGIQAVDVGPVRAAYVLEGMLGLWGNGRSMGRPFDWHIQIRPQE